MQDQIVLKLDYGSERIFQNKGTILAKICTKLLLLVEPKVCTKISKAVNNVKENYNNKI